MMNQPLGQTFLWAANYRKTNFLLRKTTVYYSGNEKTAIPRPEHMAQPQSLKCSQVFSLETGAGAHRSHNGLSEKTAVFHRFPSILIIPQTDFISFYSKEPKMLRAGSNLF